MNDHELLDYSLGQLDPPQAELLEAEAATDSALADAIARLRYQIDLMLDDGLSIEPPAGLARRTVAFVAEQGRRRTILDFVPVRVPFRWADVAVAAGIFLAGLVTLLPALQRGRSQFQQTVCTLNLQQLGRALDLYTVTHGSYPYVSPDSPGHRAGTFAVLLHDAELLPEVSLLSCPSSGNPPIPAPLPRFSDLCRKEAEAPKSSPCLKGMDYAYHLGCEGPTGRPGPVPAAMRLQSTIPLLADEPAHNADSADILEGNSPNHGGGGQNVLFADGRVHWHPSRRISPIDDDIFLNARKQPGPGVSPVDAVLAPGTFRFDGKP